MAQEIRMDNHRMLDSGKIPSDPAIVPAIVVRSQPTGIPTEIARQFGLPLKSLGSFTLL